MPSSSHSASRSASRLRLVSAGVVAPWLLVLAACGGGGSAGPDPTVPTAPSESALSASAPGELMAYVRGKLRERQALREQGGSLLLTDAVSGVAMPATATSAAGASVERSGTTVQEAGVDEDDLVKSDGTHVYTLAARPTLQAGEAAATLQLHRRQPDGSLVAEGRLPVIAEPGLATRVEGMVLAPDTLRVMAVIGQVDEYAVLPGFDVCQGRPDCVSIGLPVVPRIAKPSVALDIVTATDPAAPVMQQRVRIDGRLIGSRLVGNALVLVTQTSPLLGPEITPLAATAAEREAAIARITAADVLPSVRVNGGPARPLFAETDCWLQPKNGSPGIELTAITIVDLQATPAVWRSQCFAGGAEAIYVAPASLYLATTRWSLPTPGPGGASVLFPAKVSTDLHKFAFSRSGVGYRGTGTVDGHLGWEPDKRSYRLGEWKGDLRVLTYTGSTGWGALPDATKPPSPATLTILREQPVDRTLQPVAKLPNEKRPAPLGKPGEQVYGVRLIGDRGYVVTFRRTDPLYVLDLSNPFDPRALSELEVAGFSDYLFPLGDDLLLGVGKDADANGRVGGVKVALFDVANPAQPKQAGSIVLGRAGSVSALDFTRHGIDLFRQGTTTRVALPAVLTASDFGIGAQGLQRFEVDHATRTLRAKAALPAPLQAAGSGPATDRALQIGAQVHYFSGGTLLTAAW